MSDEDIPATSLNVEPDDLRDLGFTEDQIGSGIQLGVVLRRLRETGRLSLAKEDLDKQCDNFFKIRQTETAIGEVAVSDEVHLGSEIEVENENTEDLEALKAEIVAQNSLLHGKARQLYSLWQMTSTQRKRMGFSDMQSTLIAGVRNALGKQILPPIVKDQAQQVIDALIRLDVLGDTPDIAASQQRLVRMLEMQQDLEARIQFLRGYASEASVPDLALEYPTTIPIQRHITHMRQDWPAYRELILATWPGNQGAHQIQNEQKGKALYA